MQQVSYALFAISTSSTAFLHVCFNILCWAKMFSSIHLLAVNTHAECNRCYKDSDTSPLTLEGL